MSNKDRLVWLVQTEALARVAAGQIAPNRAICAVAQALDAYEERIPKDIVAEAIDIFRYATLEGMARPYSLSEPQTGGVHPRD